MTRRAALLLATLLLLGAGVTRRAAAHWRPPVTPLPCGPVASVITGDAEQLICLSDTALTGCDHAAPGRRYANCREVGAVPGPVLRLHDMPIDLAHATEDDLRALPGIGPGLAARITSARSEHLLCGPEDLLHVSGVGSHRVEALKGIVFSTDERCRSHNGAVRAPSEAR